MTGAVTLAGWLVLPLVVPGVVVRTKAWWSGRRGPPVLQLPWDLWRLLRKEPVASRVTTWVFHAAPFAALAAAVAAAAVVPGAGGRAVVAFAGDPVWLAYAAAFGRAARVAAALDTGSPFEGMGASRTAGFAVLVEPALFLLLGAGVVVAREPTVTAALSFPVATPVAGVVWALVLAALVVVVQVESSRMPVDDPTTHLELTMIHEVTILDHSGPALAALQLASAIELTAGLSMIAALVTPRGLPPAGAAAAAVTAILAAAVALGTVESLVARIRMRAVPAYVGVALSCGAVAALATLWMQR